LPDGGSSREALSALEFPERGHDLVVDNRIVQHARLQNLDSISIWAEARLWHVVTEFSFMRQLWFVLNVSAMRLQ
jgi:hypothetical protein